MAKLFVHLSGGLGNQMFQYASARALALRQDLELVLDNWSGFVRDYQYKRQYELSQLNIEGRLIKQLERLPIWLYRWQFRKGKKPAELFESTWYGQFISEDRNIFIPEVRDQLIKSDTWLVGYWQSPNYFNDFSHKIKQELLPRAPKVESFVKMGELIKNTESVALGIRLYEESPNPASHAFGGELKTNEQISSIVRIVKKVHPQAQIFFFCTCNPSKLKGLDLPDDTVFLTREEGYENTIDCLWLMTQCRHHILTNSSYYWMGAWLSEVIHGGTTSGQMIFVADNFINPHCFEEGWIKF